MILLAINFKILLSTLLIFVFGMISGAMLLASHLNRKLQKQKDAIENMFSKILDDCVKMQFIKRVNKYVYFKYENWELIYLLDKKSLHIFEGEHCLATSIENSKIVKNLIQYIETKWNKDINNIVIIDNNEFSLNFIEEQKKRYLKEEKWSDPLLNKLEDTKNIVEPTVDDILDKINKVGYKNLTDLEIEFLNNASK